MTAPRVPSALESLARLRTMRALLSGEDRSRFETLVAELEQAVCELEGVSADLARLVAIGVTESQLAVPATIELTGVVADALRVIDPLLASRAVLVDVEAPRPVFVLSEPERLEHLIGVALTIAASATPTRGHAQLRYAAVSGAVTFSVVPYRPRDPRATIVDALARSLGIVVSASDRQLLLTLPAAPAAAAAV